MFEIFRDCWPRGGWDKNDKNTWDPARGCHPTYEEMEKEEEKKNEEEEEEEEEEERRRTKKNLKDLRRQSQLF